MIKSLIAAACFSFVLVSCDKVDHNLQGKWQLKTVETNGTVQVVDTVWYNFQHSLFEYQFYNPASGGYGINYGYKKLESDKTLELELTSYGQPVEYFLPYTDWNDSIRVFSIEQSTVTKLVLSSEGKTYTFQKF